MRRRLLLVLIAAAGGLAGCAQALMTVRQGGNETLIKAPQPFSNAPKLALRACADKPIPQLDQAFAETSAQIDGAACDAMIHVSDSGRNWAVRAGRSGQELFSASAAVGDAGNAEARLLALVYERLAPSTELGRRLERDRKLRDQRATLATQPAVAALSLPASDVDQPSYQLPEAQDDFAVVVGIEKYADLPEARFAQRDAESMRAHLLALGFPERNVAFLAGDRAERAALEEHVEHWLPRSARRKSRVFFFFSGHGAPDAKTGEAYLLPWDADPKRLKATGYSFKRLYRKLALLKAKEIIVAIDAGFVDVGEPYRAGLAVLSAAGPRQTSSSLEEQRHGAFTYFFLKGISGEAADSSGRVTAKALHRYLSPKVQDLARTLSREQTPQLTGPGAVVVR